MGLLVPRLCTTVFKGARVSGHRSCRHSGKKEAGRGVVSVAELVIPGARCCHFLWGSGWTVELGSALPTPILLSQPHTIAAVSGGMEAMCVFYTISEGKGRFKSWMLCNGLSEGVMGQGLAAPPASSPPPTPGVAARRKDWAPKVRCPPPLPCHAERPVGAGAVPGPCEPAPPPHCRRRRPSPGGRGGRARADLPSQIACAAAHHPPLAPVEGVPRGAGSSNAAPRGAPGMTCTPGPCARRTGSAWGVAAQPSSPPPAAPVAGATKGHR